ncbi:hypothetical protein Tco_1043809 [Tanacetum coccineum]|uniref:Uncharacterized protein n=1 Tax=Tanacetum coccineum TaxID=301880 RepID=A0ABQ5GP39_9ASTR
MLPYTQPCPSTSPRADIPRLYTRHGRDYNLTTPRPECSDRAAVRAEIKVLRERDLLTSKRVWETRQALARLQKIRPVQAIMRTHALRGWKTPLTHCGHCPVYDVLLFVRYPIIDFLLSD